MRRTLDHALRTLNTKTALTVQRIPFDATASERQTFEAGHDSMQQGWTGTLDRLAAYLATA